MMLTHYSVRGNLTKMFRILIGEIGWVKHGRVERVSSLTLVLYLVNDLKDLQL